MSRLHRGGNTRLESYPHLLPGPVSKPQLLWAIIAEYPGAEPREISGFTSKAEIDDWMNGERRLAWLRSQGYAK